MRNAIRAIGLGFSGVGVLLAAVALIVEARTQALDTFWRTAAQRARTRWDRLKVAIVSRWRWILSTLRIKQHWHVEAHDGVAIGDSAVAIVTRGFAAGRVDVTGRLETFAEVEERLAKVNQRLIDVEAEIQGIWSQATSLAEQIRSQRTELDDEFKRREEAQATVSRLSLNLGMASLICLSVGTVLQGSVSFV